MSKTQKNTYRIRIRFFMKTLNCLYFNREEEIFKSRCVLKIEYYSLMVHKIYELS